jgi:cytochrome bd-type quinol oxidase subunit 2
LAHCEICSVRLTILMVLFLLLILQKKNMDDTDSNAKWAVISSAITFAVTTIVVALHMSPTLSGFIVNTKVEGCICIILTAFWAATVSVVSNAHNGLAVDSDKDNTIVNGNLYYFSWAGFVTSVMLCVAYLRSAFGVDLAGEISQRAKRLTTWSGLLACQLVVMGSSANIFDKDCTSQLQSDAFCARTKYGISLGAIGTILSLGVVAMKMVTSVAPFVVEGCLTIVLCIMNGFGVTFLTSAKGPGSPIGNLYYFTWLSFITTIMLVANCYEDYANIGVPDESEDDTNKEEPDDLPVETIEGDGV